MKLWLVVAAVVLVAGQLAVGMRASTTSPITGDEPFYVVTAQSLLSDGDLDLRDEYADREYDSWWRAAVPLWRQMEPAADGRLLSPHDPGLSVLIAPAFALGGVEGAQRLLVVVWAAAMATAAVVARRYGVSTVASGAAGIVVGIGAPGIVYASQLYPEGPAALGVALALALVTARRARPVLLALVLTALLWLGVKYAAVALLLAAAWAWRWRHERRAVAGAAVLALVAGVHYVGWHLTTFGGLTPYSVNVVWAGAPDTAILRDHLDLRWRSYRLYGLFLDARFGLLRWLPLTAVAAWGLRRGQRSTFLPAAVFSVGVLVGTFASITMMGWWFPGRLLVAGMPGLVVLLAAGIARVPRTSAVLGAWSVAIGAGVAWSATHGGIRLAVDPFTLGAPLPPAVVFPDFREFGAPQIARSLAWGALLLLPPAWRAPRRARRTAPTPTPAVPVASMPRSV